MPKAKNKKPQHKKHLRRTQEQVKNKGLNKTEIFIDNSRDIKEETPVLSDRSGSSDKVEMTVAGGNDQNIDAGKDHFKIVFSWETVDFIKSPKTQLYIIAAVLGSMGMIVWGIMTKSFTMSLMFIMLAVVSIMVLNEPSQKIRVRVTEEGVDINDEHFNFSDFRSFTVTRMHDMEVLNLNRKEKYFPPKMVYIEDEPVGDLRDFLGIYLPEDQE